MEASPSHSNILGSIVAAICLVGLAAANCWIVQQPLPLYKLLPPDSRIWGSIPYFDRLIESNPNNWKNYFRRGRAYERVGYFQSALSDYDMALRYHPKSPRIIQRRTWVLYCSRNFSKALNDCNWLMSARTPTAADYIQRSRILEQLSQPDKALIDANRAVVMEPNSGWAHIVRAYAYLSARNLPEAKTDYSIAAKLLPPKSNFVAQLCAAQLFIAQKQWHKAIKSCDEVLLSNPYGWNASCLRALALYNLGNYDQAACDATASIGRTPLQAAPYLIRAQVYYQLKKYSNADRDRRTAAEIDPTLRSINDICYYTLPL
jgi:tetratricopeptide (TPR) repeat protein